MASNPADAILSTIGARSEAWQTKVAAQQRKQAGFQEAMDSFGAKLAEIPTLVKQAREEREAKDIGDAALGGYLHGGWDGMEQAALALPTTTPGGTDAKLKLFATTQSFKDRQVARVHEEETRQLRERTSRAISQAFAPKDQVQLNPLGGVPGTLGQLPRITKVHPDLEEGLSQIPNFADIDPNTQMAAIGRLAELKVAGMKDAQASQKLAAEVEKNRAKKQKDEADLSYRALKLAADVRQGDARNALLKEGIEMRGLTAAAILEQRDRHFQAAQSQAASIAERSYSLAQKVALDHEWFNQAMIEVRTGTLSADLVKFKLGQDKTGLRGLRYLREKASEAGSDETDLKHYDDLIKVAESEISDQEKALNAIKVNIPDLPEDTSIKLPNGGRAAPAEKPVKPGMSWDEYNQ